MNELSTKLDHRLQPSNQQDPLPSVVERSDNAKARMKEKEREIGKLPVTQPSITAHSSLLVLLWQKPLHPQARQQRLPH